MTLSPPVSPRKRTAKQQSPGASASGEPNAVVAREAVDGGSRLASRHLRSSRAKALLAQLAPGDLLLLGARPRQGKTLFSLELTLEAMARGRPSAFFTLELTEGEVLTRFDGFGVPPDAVRDLLEIDCSDAISADYITDRLRSLPDVTFLVIDYLQLLDQRRENAPLDVQIRSLGALAKDRGLIIVCLSQIDRAYELSDRPCPDARDVRLPNPLDVSVFTKSCFLNRGEICIRVSS